MCFDNDQKQAQVGTLVSNQTGREVECLRTRDLALEAKVLRCCEHHAMQEVVALPWGGGGTFHGGGFNFGPDLVDGWWKGGVKQVSSSLNHGLLHYYFALPCCFTPPMRLVLRFHFSGATAVQELRFSFFALTFNSWDFVWRKLDAYNTRRNMQEHTYLQIMGKQNKTRKKIRADKDFGPVRLIPMNKMACAKARACCRENRQYPKIGTWKKWNSVFFPSKTYTVHKFWHFCGHL